jgi:hypothetical protein
MLGKRLVMAVSLVMKMHVYEVIVQAALNLLKAKRYTPYIYRDGIWKRVDHWNTCTLLQAR